MYRREERGDKREKEGKTIMKGMRNRSKINRKSEANNWRRISRGFENYENKQERRLDNVVLNFNERLM